MLCKPLIGYKAFNFNRYINQIKCFSFANLAEILSVYWEYCEIQNLQDHVIFIWRCKDWIKCIYQASYFSGFCRNSVFLFLNFTWFQALIFYICLKKLFLAPKAGILGLGISVKVVIHWRFLCPDQYPEKKCTNFSLHLITGPIPFIVVSEIFRQEPRAAAMSFSLAFNWICNFILMLTFRFIQVCTALIFIFP